LKEKLTGEGAITVERGKGGKGRECKESGYSGGTVAEFRGTQEITGSPLQKIKTKSKG